MEAVIFMADSRLQIDSMNQTKTKVFSVSPVIHKNRTSKKILKFPGISMNELCVHSEALSRL